MNIKFIMAFLVSFMLALCLNAYISLLVNKDKQPTIIEQTPPKGSCKCVYLQVSNDQIHWVAIDTLTLKYK